jgi:hypothetical protein
MTFGIDDLPLGRDELDAHVALFEAWFRKQQEAHGMENTSLISVEHAILRSYITWLRNDYAQNRAH